MIYIIYSDDNYFEMLSEKESSLHKKKNAVIIYTL